MSEYLKGNRWPIQMLELLREAIHHRKTEGCSEEKKLEFEKQFNKLLEDDYPQRSKGKQEVFDSFRKAIAKHKEHIFTFLSNPDVPYDNNASERSLRAAKTKLKVSGQFKSKEGAMQYATLQSIMQTAIKNGTDPLVTLTAIANYNGLVVGGE